MAMYDWTEGKFGVDFDEYGPLPDSLDDPRRPYGTGAPTFSDWLLVCGIASIAGMSAGDPRIATIHAMRILAIHFHFPRNAWAKWGWNGRAEVERAAVLCFDCQDVEVTPAAIAAVWSLYVRWLDHCGRFVKGLDQAATSVLRNAEAQSQAENVLLSWKRDHASRLFDKVLGERSAYAVKVAALSAELAALKAPA